MNKKIIQICTILTAAFVLAGCTTNNSEISSHSEDTTSYTITFNSNGGSPVANITANAGSSVSKPVNPSKTDNVFKEWHYDSALSSLVSWPITLNSDLTLYAKWQNSRDHFLEARDNTINSNQFEYDFNLNVITAYGSIEGPSAIIGGTTKYNSNANSTYLHFEERTGLLIGDGKIYKVKTGTDLMTFKLNKNDKLTSYSVETVPNNYKYDTSSFAKALFEFDQEQILSVTSSNQKFALNFSGSFTGFINSTLTFLNHPIVDVILQQWITLPNHDSNLAAYVTFENGCINTFEYEFTISVTDASLTLSYSLDFVKVGNGVTITPPDFSGVAISESAVSAKLDTIKTALNAYRATTYSGYNYRLDTKVDYPNAFAIDSTIQGRTMRKIDQGISYFWNRIDLDSDYKNNDLYNDKGIIDYERYRVKYANQSVYDVEDRTFPLSNLYTEIANYANDSLDSFYFLLPNDFYTTANISTVEEKSTSGVTTYSLGLSQASVPNLLAFADDSARLDLAGTNEFNIYNVESSLDIKSSEFDIVITSGVFTSLLIDVEGRYVGSYEDTDFSGPLDFELKLEIVANELGNNYVPPTQNSEVILSNT